MSGAVKALAIFVGLIVVIGGAVWVASMLPGDQQDPDTMTIKFHAWDSLAGSQDAVTSAVDIYRNIDGEPVKQETVTMNAAQVESAKTYTSFETLYLYIYDATDVSVCKQYLTWDVPQGTPAAVFDGSFQCELPFVDRGNTAYDILIKDHNNTAIADAATLDVTNNSWDTDYAELDFELRNTNDDCGYVNSYNFLRKYDNNHYIVFKATGTGWDSVNLLTTSTDEGAITSYDKASARYFVIELDDDSITRDKLAVGDYRPDGTMSLPLVFDFTGFEAGDSVTFTYEYRYYSSWDKFQDSSSWGTDSATNPATSETVTIQY